MVVNLTFLDWLYGSYLSLRQAVFFGAMIAFVFLLKLFWYFWKRRRFSRSFSGDGIKKYETSRVWRVLYIVPKIFVAAAILFQLAALAKPYESHSSIQTNTIETREVFYLIDGSSSMLEGFGNSGKTKAQVARNTLLNFLRLRKDQKEFSCLWLFSDNAYRLSACTIDGYAFRFQVFSAPLFLNIQGEGGTNIQAGVAAVLSFIDYRLKKNRAGGVPKKRILIIVTDGEISFYPAAEFAMLHQRGVIPYLLWVKKPGLDPSNETLRLVAGIREYGGRVFEVGEEQELIRALQAINAREKPKIEIKRYTHNIPLFQKPLFISFVFLAAALVLHLVLEIPLGERID